MIVIESRTTAKDGTRNIEPQDHQQSEVHWNRKDCEENFDRRSEREKSDEGNSTEKTDYAKANLG
jgi:hypothetical protein